MKKVLPKKQPEAPVELAKSVPKKDLVSEEHIRNKTQKVMDAKIVKLIGSLRSDLESRDGKKQEQMEKLLTMLSASLSRDLPITISKIVSEEVSAQTARMEDMIRTELRNSNAAVMNAMSSVVQNTLAGTVRVCLDQSLEQHLRSTIVPSFENACREMFGQMHQTLKEGLKGITSGAGSMGGDATQLASTLSQAQSLVASLSSIPQANIGAQHVGESQPSLPTMKHAAISLEEIEQRQDPTIEIGKCLRSQHYQEAFSKALLTQNIAIVTWLLQQVDENTIFSTSPCPLSQGVLLSLLQQLGSNLGEDTLLKVSWVQKILLTLDTTLDYLVPHMIDICELVQTNMRQVYPTLPSSESQGFQILEHVLNSLMHSLKSKVH